MALSIFAWGLAALGVLLVVEAAVGGAVYNAMVNTLYEPTRLDLAQKNVVQASSVLALLWPVVLAGGLRVGAPRWLALPMVAGAVLLALRLYADAPVLAVAVSLAVGAASLAWPRDTPKALSVLTAGYLLLAPAVVLGVRSLGLQVETPASWSQRLAYWSYVVDRIADEPLRGWGLHSSRAFSPHIQLHPHNVALQYWLELGAVGAALAAAFWALSLRRLSRPTFDAVAAGTTASAAVYLLFGAMKFGAWQENWLALGAMVAVVGALAMGDLGAGKAAKTSTSPGPLE